MGASSWLLVLNHVTKVLIKVINGNIFYWFITYWRYFPNLLDTINIRNVRRAGDQPSEGNCQVFKWGGSSGVHWYACCNNCLKTNPNYNPSCDSETYQGGSSISYCDHCGEDKGTGDADKFKTEFKCGGCDGQAAKRQKCKSNLRKLYNVPGFCWAHSRCFKKHCQKSYGRKKREIKDIPDTCFNLQCEPGETPENCPVDCCYKNNPSACTWKDNTCVDECCGEPSCCPTSAGNILNTDIRCNIVLFIALIFII